MAISLCIELIQYCAGTGLAEFDDIISNGLGALMGYGIGYCLVPVRGQRWQKNHH